MKSSLIVARHSMVRTVAALSFVVLLTMARAAPGGIVVAIDDLWETPMAGANFASDPIPASFFDSGSLPFNGTITLRGQAGGPGSTDTIIRRSSDPIVMPPSPPNTDTIPIEIVQLHLVSVNPITVTYPSMMELWNVEVLLSPTPSPPSSPASMTVTKQHPNGGTFDATFTVVPYLTFTRQSDSQVRILDFGATSRPPEIFQITSAPWADMPAAGYPAPCCGTNFYPGVDPNTGQRVPVMAMSNPFSLTMVPAGVPEPRAWLMLGAVAVAAGAVAAAQRLHGRTQMPSASSP